MKKILLILFIVLTHMSIAQEVEIYYKVAMPKPWTYFFEVEMTLNNLPSSDNIMDFKLPVWRPGRYLIFDFSTGIQEFNSIAGDKDLKWYKTDKSTWRVEKGTESKVKISYRVFANEFATRTRGIDDEHAFINETAVFMYVEKYRHNPLTLKVEPYSDWHVTTGLDKKDGTSNLFTAPNYDYFVDCPLEIGNQTDFDFDVDGYKHTISIYGDAKYDKQKMIDGFSKIIKANYDFWGNVPYEHYTFIIHCNNQSSGGTEHINSTILGIRPGQFESESGFEGILRLVSHEFFHTWNVKQLKPKGLTPYDFSKENYTSELWIAEGSTSYYDGLIITRTGQMSVDAFHKEIARGVEDERRRPGNKVQSLAESSFDAWVKFWKRSANSYNSESDYYAKGSYVSMILDLEIRKLSGNNRSLDNVFRKMYEEFPLDKKGYTNEDFRIVCEEMAGASLKQFFDDYVYGTKSIEWERYLGYAGLELKSSDSTVLPIVGIKASQKDGKVIINEIVSGSSGEDAGLMVGDEIIVMDGSRLSYSEMESKIKNLKEGDSVKITVFRNDKMKEVTLTLRNAKIANYFVEKTKDPTGMQKNIYESWLNTKW